MVRSIWKGPVLEKDLLKKINKLNKYGFIWTRSWKSVIIPEFVGKSFRIHNGRNFEDVLITDQMIGHKFGEFSYSRKIGVHKKNK